ncbi:protein of unknown function [Parapedobacter composti]|uniref:FecR protein n=1 Tax=Parapedobacter composti TaxID=623281 RepID=A0A1I1DSM8_9SPHI|nr:FecR domain-containing protein [Parapedobacter composti]SFB77901.1 protein of unknown function [Parapedobacter composti]
MAKPVDVEQLIADKLSGNLSSNDAKMLDRLIASDPEIRNRWEEASQTLSLYQAANFADNIPVDRRFDDLLVRMKNTEPVGDGMQRRQPMQWLAIAAAVLLPVIAFSLWFGLRTDPDLLVRDSTTPDSVYVTFNNGRHVALDDSHPIQVGALTLAASEGKRHADAARLAVEPGDSRLTVWVPKAKTYRLELPDGSLVHLNAGSRLEFPSAFSDSTRVVFLEGEAFFDVQEDEDRPFSVATGDITVQVLGTSFNLQAYEAGAAQVALVKGKVRLEVVASGAQTELSPGMAAQLRPDGSLENTPFDAETVLGWQEGVYFFHNEPLEHIMTMVNRASGTEFIIANPQLTKLRFSGAFETAKPVSVLMHNLAGSSTLRYRITGNKVVLF